MRHPGGSEEELQAHVDGRMMATMRRITRGLLFGAAVIAAAWCLGWIPLAVVVWLGGLAVPAAPDGAKAFLGSIVALFLVLAAAGAVVSFRDRCTRCGRRKIFLYEGLEDDSLCTRCRRAADRRA
jgi:hypothetical protein